MAWPLAVGMLSNTLMGVVDTLLMGQVGTAAQAGVGLATTLFFFFLSFFLGMSTGPQSLVAAANGARDDLRVKMAGGAGILLSLVSAAAAVCLLAMLYKPLLGWVVNDAAVVQNTSDYIRIRLFGMPFSIMYIGLLCGVQGLGDTRSRMMVSLAANGLNIVLDFVLIFGCGPIPRLEASGAAIATVLSMVLAFALMGRRYLRLLSRPVMPSAEVVFSSVKVGLPSGMERLMGVFAFVVISLVLARIGAVHLAAFEIVLNIISVSFLPGFSIGEAGGILVGRYLGAGKNEAAGRSLHSARTMAVALMSACGVLFAIRGDWLASFFTIDPEVARIAGVLMIYAAIFQVFDALTMVHICALRGAGDTRFSLAVTTVASWGLTVPLTLFFALHLDWGAPGAFLAMTLELIALASITGWRVRGIRKGRVGRLDLLLGRTAQAT